jgi:guanylate cyclase
VRRLFAWAASLGARPDDSEDLRLQRALLVGGFLFLGCPMTFGYGLIYGALGAWPGGLTMIAEGLLALVSIAVLVRTRHFEVMRWLLLGDLLLGPFVVTAMLGGFAPSSAFCIFAVVAPFGSLLWYSNLRAALRWFVAFIALVALIAAAQPILSPTPMRGTTVLLVVNVGACVAVSFVFLFYFVDQRNRLLELLRTEQRKSEALLLNILPSEVAALLKQRPGAIAEHFYESSILFADVVGFTPLASALSPDGLVRLLNEVFSGFDEIVTTHGLEKIKTIGDCYMVAAGVPRRRTDHAQAITRVALQMLAFTRTHAFEGGQRLQFRIGIHSGPVVAGVIGQRKFAYDLWGDTVNTASRMESHGVADGVQISRSTYDLIKDDFVCEPRGSAMVKGKGEMEVWLVTGERQSRVVAS